MAYTIHTAYMCEAFANLGAQVRLYHRGSPQEEGAMGEQDGFEWYGVPRNFKAIHIPRYRQPPRSSMLALVAYLGAHALLSIRAVLWRADLYITRSLSMAQVTAWLGFRTILEIHEVPEFIEGHNVSYLVQLTRRRRLTLVAVSERDRQLLIDAGVSAAKVVKLSNAVRSAESNHADADTQSAARKACNLVPDAQIVVYTGQLYEGKGVEVLVRAAAYMPEVTVVVVGGREFEVAPFRTCATDNVVFAGEYSPAQTRLFQSAADVLVVPQTAESRFQCPLKIYEYAKARRPIVASDVGLFKDFLTDEESALIYAKDDAQQLAKAVQRLVSNSELAERLTDKAYNNLCGWTWELRAETELKSMGLASPK